MTNRLRTPARLLGKILAPVLLLLLGCLDGGGPTSPSRQTVDSVTLHVASGVVTVGVVSSAYLQLPSGVELEAGSVTWVVTPSTAADVRRLSAREDSVDLVFKSGGVATVEVRYAVRVGSPGSLVGAIGTGSIAQGGSVHYARTAAVYIASYGIVSDSTSVPQNSGGGVGGALIAQTQMVGLLRDSTIAGKDGFAAVHGAMGTPCAGFDWTLAGTGALTFGAAAVSGSMNSTASASAPSRSATTLVPFIQFHSVAVGVDTVVMRHRECTGACADTMIVVVKQTPTGLRVDATSPASMAAGLTAASPISVRLVDGTGALTAVDGATITATTTAAGLTLTSTTGRTVRGVATFDSLKLSGRTGNYRLNFATTGVLTPAPHDVQLTPGLPAAFTWPTAFPAVWPAATGLMSCPVVQLMDAFGNAVPRAGVTVTVRGPGAAAPVLSTATTDASGLATLCGVTLTGAGTSVVLSVTATGTGFSAVTAAITVRIPADPPVLTLTPSPVTLAIDDVVRLTATVAERGGVVFAVSTDAIAASHFAWTSATPAVATVDATGTVRAVTMGVATIQATALGVSGTVRVTTTPGAPSPVTTTATYSSLTVTPSASLLATVVVRDAQGNVVTTITASHLAAVASAGTVGAFTCDAGSCTVTYTAPPTAGTPRLTLTIDGQTMEGSPVDVTVLETATQIASNAGNAQSATAGAAVVIAPSVIVKDVHNVAVQGVRVTFAVASGGGSVTGGVATTNAGGIATVGSWTLGATTGANTLTATSGTLTGSPVTFTATGTVGALDHFAITATNGAPLGNQAVNTTFNVKLVAQDAHNNTVTSFTGTVVLTASGATLSGTPVTSASFTAGELSSTELTLSTTGTGVTIGASNGGAPAKTGTSAAFTVTATTPTFSLALSAASVALGAAAPTVTPTSNSAGATSYASGTPSVATITSGGAITLVGVGSTVITGSLAANGVYAAATTTVTLTVTTGAARVTPTFSPVAGSVVIGTTVTITSAGADAIYYTTNGSDPTVASTNQATTPLVITTAVTVKALAVKANYANSAIGSAAYTVTSGPLDHFAITATNGTALGAHGKNTAFNIKLVALDASNNTVTDFTSTVVLTASGATLSGTPLTSASFTAGVLSSQALTLTTTGTGVTIRASDGGSPAKTGTSAAFNVTAATTQFTLNAPADIGAFERAAYTVTRLDAGAAAVTSGTQVVYLTSNSTGANKKFYDAASGGSVITQVTIADGLSTANVWYYDEKPGSWTITASDATPADGATGIADATDALAVTFGTPSAATSTFALGGYTIAAGGTTTALTAMKDAAGNLVTSVIPAQFVASAPSGSYGAWSCGGGYCNSTFTVPTTPGSVSLSVTIGGTAISGSPQTVNVTAAATSAFFLSAPADIAAGNRAAYTVTRKDTYGNLVTSGAQVVYLTSSSTGANKKFYDAASDGNAITQVTIANGASSATVWYYDEKAGSWTITASDATPSNGATGIADATDELGVTRGMVFFLTATMAVSANTVTIGSPLTVTVTVKDIYLNAGSSTEYLGFEEFMGTGTLGAWSCPLGVCTATWTAPNTVGNQSLSISMGGVPIMGTPKTIAVTAGATASFTLSAPADITAGTRAAYTISRKDAGNNAVTSGTQVVYLTSNSSGGNKKFFDAASGGSVITQVTIASGASTASVWYYDEKPGSWTITASDATPANGATGIADATDALGVTVAAASKLAVTTVPLGPWSDMAFGTQPVITVQDAYGNTVTGSSASVTVTVSAGATIGGTATVSAASGIATFVGLSLSDGLAGPTTYTLTFTSAGLTSATQTIAITQPTLLLSSQETADKRDRGKDSQVVRAE